MHLEEVMSEIRHPNENPESVSPSQEAKKPEAVKPQEDDKKKLESSNEQKPNVEPQNEAVTSGSGKKHKPSGNDVQENGKLSPEGNDLPSGESFIEPTPERNKLSADLNADSKAGGTCPEDPRDKLANKESNYAENTPHSSESPSKKLDDSNAETKPSGEIQPKNDGKEKLENIDPKEKTLDNKKPEEVEATMNGYFSDLKNRSEYPETIKDQPFESKDLKKLSPEETAAKRDEFDDKKAELKNQWSEENGQPWPKYDEDVYSSNGKLIRKAGSDYDAHHIQPLGMNGQNEASNITPLHANEHYDKQGVHAPDSPYSRLDKML